MRYGTSKSRNDKSISLTQQTVLTECVNIAFCSCFMAVSVRIVIRKFTIIINMLHSK